MNERAVFRRIDKVLYYANMAATGWYLHAHDWRRVMVHALCAILFYRLVKRGRIFSTDITTESR